MKNYQMMEKLQGLLVKLHKEIGSVKAKNNGIYLTKYFTKIQPIVKILFFFRQLLFLLL